MTTYAEPTVRGALKSQAKVLGVSLTAMYIMFVATWLSHGALLSLGIIPRNVLGLRGILFAPFLHGSLAHLLANTIPFAILGWLVMLRESRHFTYVTVASMIGSGVLAWLIGASGSVHVGASGVIFGYLGFLIFSGWYSRSLMSVTLSILAVFFWGGLLYSVLPGEAGISWQAHLGGFIGGVYSARRFRVA